MVICQSRGDLWDYQSFKCLCQDGTGVTAASTGAASGPARAPVTATESAGSSATETSGKKVAFSAILFEILHRNSHFTEARERTWTWPHFRPSMSC